MKLTDLTKQPGWDELKKIFAAQKERHQRELLRQMLSTEPLDQRRIDRLAGFWLGCEFILKNPEMAEASLKAAIRQAKLLEEAS
jgi:hypothetical protein